MSEHERPEEAAERDNETTAPRLSLTTHRTRFELEDQESRGYDPYNASTAGRSGDVWRRERRRT
jgi:hypothetical protein